MQPTLAFTSLVPMAFVKSVPGSIAFYATLGFEVGATHRPEGESEPVWAWLRSGGAHLMVSRASAAVVASEQAILFYLYCEDVPAMHAALEAKGVEVGPIRFPFYCPRGEFRVTDPDGYALLIAHT